MWQTAWQPQRLRIRATLASAPKRAGSASFARAETTWHRMENRRPAAACVCGCAERLWPGRGKRACWCGPAAAPVRNAHCMWGSCGSRAAHVWWACGKAAVCLGKGCGLVAFILRLKAADRVRPTRGELVERLRFASGKGAVWLRLFCAFYVDVAIPPCLACRTHVIVKWHLHHQSQKHTWFRVTMTIYCW